MNALLHLLWTSARNRFVSKLQRLRSPRYAAGLIAGVLYVWWFLVRPANRAHGASFLLGQETEIVVTVLLVATLMGSWVFGADASALAFSEAEVSLLFAAPLSRRQLIAFKLVRAQLAVVVNTLIWVFILHRGGTALPAGLRAISLWVLFTTLNWHRLAAALVRSSWGEHRSAGVRRQRWAIAAFALVGAALVVGIVRGWSALFAVHGMAGFFGALPRVLGRPPASVALYPFALVVAPTFAHTVAVWAREILPAVAIMLLHGWWVLHSDAAFEEAAIEASARRARRLEARSRQLVAGPAAPRAATSTLALAAAGHPAMAIVWKNMLCLRRTVQLRVFIGPTVMAIFVGAAASDNGASGAEVVATCAMAFAGMLVLFGGRLIRNDLRHDMLHLPLLKSLPIAAQDLVLAEVASAALPMAAVQLLSVIIAYVAALISAHAPLAPAVRIALLVGAPFALVAVNGALLTIQNGTALLFPAWVRLGPTVNAGVERLGQNLLSMVASLILLGIALVIPALIGWAVTTIYVGASAAGVATTMIVGAIVLGAETYGAIRLLGGAFARAEPLQAT